MITVLQNLWAMILVTAVALLVGLYIYGWIEQKVKTYLNKRKPD